MRGDVLQVYKVSRFNAQKYVRLWKKGPAELEVGLHVILVFGQAYSYTLYLK